MARHRADAYRIAVQAWDKTATEQDRIDLRGFPWSPTLTLHDLALASIEESGDIVLHVGYLSEEQAQALVRFVREVYAPFTEDSQPERTER